MDNSYKTNKENNHFHIHFELQAHSEIKYPLEAPIVDAKSIVDVCTFPTYMLQYNKAN